MRFALFFSSLLPFLTGLFWAAGGAAQVPFVCTGQNFLTLGNSASSLNEIVIDPVTGAATLKVIAPSLGIGVNAAGYRPSDNLIYCLDPNNLRLVRVDATGDADVLASLPLDATLAYFAGAITPDSRYLVVIGGTGFNGRDIEIVAIDLDDPTYSMTRVPATGSITRIFDIAFHPETGVLYGYDSAGNRVVRVDYNTGIVSAPYPAIPDPDLAGTVFFDAFGSFFAYGGVDTQNTLYRLDLETGAATVVTTGPDSQGSDGCSCPYIIELTKTVAPETTYPCTDVEYTFTIVNASGQTRSGIDFQDVMPPGFQIVSVGDQPFGGLLTGGAGTDFLKISGMTIPPGRKEFKIKVNIGDSHAGEYFNQAHLSNLPVSLGETRPSDNPRTIVSGDSTRLLVRGIPFDTLRRNEGLCEGQALLLDVKAYGTGYRWENGSTAASLEIQTGGRYRATVTAGCDTALVFFEVRESAIALELAQDSFYIQLGDSIWLQSQVFNTGQTTVYQWIDPLSPSLACSTCPDTWARPFDDVRYLLRVQNEAGCADSASARVLVDKTRHIYIPNVFNPDASVPNDRFFLSGDPYARVRRLLVYSRWGETVFESTDKPLNDPFSGWDGMFRGKRMNPGVFVWRAEVAFLDGSVAAYSGDVLLLR